MSDNELKIINHSITRLLASREHSQYEIVSKLVAKGLNERLIREQLDVFIQENLQSDMRFVESFIRSKSQKGQGRTRIEMALRQHHIEDTLIEHGFVCDEHDFYHIALEVYRKKYADSPITDWNDKQKRMRFLQYRGFSTEQINYVLKQLA